MRKFTIGFNHTKSFLEVIHVFKGFVHEIYFQAPKRIMGSGRVIHEDKDYDKTVTSLIKTCKKNRIETNLLLNATCEGDDCGDKKHADKIILYLKKLQKEGLSSVSVTNPIHIQRIKKEVPKLKIHSSVNCYVKNVEHAKYLKHLGVDVLTIDRDINRDVKLIKKIKKDTGLKIKIIVNEGCLKNCPYRQAHFNMISHQKDTDYFDEMSCVNIYREFPEKVFQIPFIRPEDLKKYDGVVDYFKISTRTSPTQKIPMMLDAYLRESFEGDLLSLLSTKGLFDHYSMIDNRVLNKEGFGNMLWSCDNECEKCSYCSDLLKKAAKTVKI